MIIQVEMGDMFERRQRYTKYQIQKSIICQYNNQNDINFYILQKWLIQFLKRVDA